jgi:DNA-binding NarL/FixJ family response regulator
MVHNGVKILVVDDTDLVVQRLLEILKELECVESLFKAYSYDEAVEQIEKELPAIVLLDIQMPGKNGIELLGYIKKNFPEIIVIMLTNKVSYYYKELCESMGANHFVDKSREFEKIPRIIESFIPEKKY